MLVLALTTAAALQFPEDDQRGDYLLGWRIDPPAAIEGEETELDRLSRSPSGLGFFPQFSGGLNADRRVPVSVTLRALDKVTARFSDLEVPIGEPQSFGSLTLLPRTCSTNPPEEFPETTVFLEVFATESDVAGQRVRQEAEEQTAELEVLEPGAGFEPVSIQATIDEQLFGEALFRGWMFASSPSINAMEHPTYDVWVIDCKMEEPDTEI